jgi:nicotinamidase-related amidase
MADNTDFHGVAEVVGGGLPDVRVTPRTALMIIDMQLVDAHRDHGIGASGRRSGWTDQMEYYFRRVEEIVTPNIARILEAFRAQGLPVVHVRVMNQRLDNRDTSWRYKVMGVVVPPDAIEAEFLPELAPIEGEVVLNKTTSSVFMSTNADFVLRNMGVESIVMTGVVTNNCVESSTRNATDIGYRVMLVGDCCAAWTEEGHNYALRHLDRNFARVVDTEWVLGQVEQVETPDAAAAG